MRIRKEARKLLLGGLVGGFLGCLSLNGCNGGSGGSTGPPPPPSITIKSVSVYYPGNIFLSGTYAIGGQGAFTLLVNGTEFTSSSVVEWNGNSLPTEFGDGTDIAASVSSSLIVAPGKATITVSDSRATSNALVLPIASPAAATAGVVALITVATDGSPANGDSLVGPSISATGRYVAFQSNATNLASGPASSYQEIYERDTCIGALSGCTPGTIRITMTYDGSQVNGHSRDSAVSANGRYVAFESSASNLLNLPQLRMLCTPAGMSCVFLRDTCTGAASGCVPSTTLVSTSADGSPANGGSPSMSPDARLVAFNSTGQTNGVNNVFIRDTCIGAPSGCAPSTTLVSTSLSGSGGDANSFHQDVNATGRYVAFESYATNLVPGETMVPGIFFRDTCTGLPGSCVPNMIRVDVTTDGTQPNMNAFTETPAVSSNGRLVAFGSEATNMVSTNVQGQGNVYARDTCSGVAGGCTPSTSLVSLANDGSVANCGSPGNNGRVSMSADGRFVAFGSIATNLTPDGIDRGPACNWEDIFVRDTCFGVTSGCFPSTVRVSVANKPNPGMSANAISIGNAMSADGHYVVFISSATNLFPGLTGSGHQMVYLAMTGF
jgi:Tol biopolymer transport system component